MIENLLIYAVIVFAWNVFWAIADIIKGDGRMERRWFHSGFLSWCFWIYLLTGISAGVFAILMYMKQC